MRIAAARVDHHDTAALGLWRHVPPFKTAVSAVAWLGELVLQGCYLPLHLQGM